MFKRSTSTMLFTTGFVASIGLCLVGGLMLPEPTSTKATIGFILLTQGAYWAGIYMEKLINVGSL